MRNQLSGPLSAVFVIFLLPTCAAVAAEPTSWTRSQPSDDAGTFAPTVTPDNDYAISQPDAVWIDGRWLWDKESGELVWFSGCMNMPISCAAGSDGNQAYCFWSDCGSFNMTFGLDFGVSGGSAVVVQRGPASAAAPIVRDFSNRSARSVPRAPAGHMMKAPIRHAPRWYQSAAPMRFVLQIEARTGTISRAIRDNLNTAAVFSGKQLALVSSKAAAIGAPATAFGAKAASVTADATAHVAAHALKK